MSKEIPLPDQANLILRLIEIEGVYTVFTAKATIVMGPGTVHLSFFDSESPQQRRLKPKSKMAIDLAPDEQMTLPNNVSVVNYRKLTHSEPRAEQLRGYRAFQQSNRPTL